MNVAKNIGRNDLSNSLFGHRPKSSGDDNPFVFNQLLFVFSKFSSRRNRASGHVKNVVADYGRLSNLVSPDISRTMYDRPMDLIITSSTRSPMVNDRPLMMTKGWFSRRIT